MGGGVDRGRVKREGVIKGGQGRSEVLGGGSQFIGVSWEGRPSGWLSRASVAGPLPSSSGVVTVDVDGLILV